MKSVSKFLVLSLAIITISVASISAQNQSRSSGRSIEQQIFKKLIGLPRYGVFDHITYQVNGGEVILGGNVYSLGTSRSAESVVKRIPGITNVVNNIRDLPPSSFDNQIRREALQTFAEKGLYRYLYEFDPEVRIVVDGGRITLVGYVANSGDFNLFNILANGISGVFSVQNNLIVGKDSQR